MTRIHSFPKWEMLRTIWRGKKKKYREVMVVGGLVARSCPTLCNPMNSSPPGSSVHGISQSRIMGWLLFPSPGDLPDPGIKPISLYWQVDSLPLSNLESPTWTRESSYWRHKAFKPVIWLLDQSHLRKYLFFFSFLELLKTFIYLIFFFTGG